MNEFYKFASESPFLTFFLGSMSLSGVVQVVRHLSTLVGVLIRGQPGITNNYLDGKEVGKK